MQKQETERVIGEFNIRASEVSAGLERRLLSNAEILHGVAGLFTSSVYVTRNEFQRYIKQLDLHSYNPGIQGVGYIQLIPGSQKEQHITAVRADGFPNYSIHPSGKRDIYSSIVFIEPLNWRNKRAMGYDIQTDPIRMKAASRARDEGEAAMTDKIILQQETDKDVQSGVIIFSPIYQVGMATSTAEQRQKALRGWAYAPIRIKDMLENYLQLEYKDLSRKIAIRLYSGDGTKASGLMYDSYPIDSANTINNDNEETIISFQLLGTTWTLYIKPLPAYWLTLEQEKNSGIVMGAGLILSLLFALVSYVLVNSHLRVANALQEITRANRSLTEQESLLRAIYDSSSVAVMLVSIKGIIIYINQRVVDLFFIPREKLIGSDFYQLIPHTEQLETRQEIEKLLKKKTDNFTLERQYLRNNADNFLGLVTGSSFHDDNGKIIGIVMVIEDITERRKNETAMRLASTVLNASPGGILVTDANKRIISVNPAFTRITGYTLDDVIDKNPRLLSSGQQDKEFYRVMWMEINRTGRWEGELVNRRKDGRLLPELLSISRVLDKNGNVAHYVGMFLDISERREAEKRIQHLAHHDYLTDLPNRSLLVERATNALALAHRHQRRMAILFIDLDRFKPINDEYGHDAGDTVLKTIAKRLLQMVRESDTVCRQGGDEFVILIPEFTDTESLERLAIKLRDEIQKPCTIKNYQLSVSASIGIATYPENGDTVDDIIQSADTAMYRAKIDTETRICFARYLKSVDPL
ncbi:CHASE domain-containing protein [uncultured Tolumonas sp.]|uniref:sensor domain-containing diguanylate cyclase n=1 Tax=uncultured Tolumonas sp. TaxID=263765 RepID=UPI002A0A5B6B|nr:CHASE domain-containing protein [uncultured Tolumonas sp.]